jgi:hypothetical protein
MAPGILTETSDLENVSRSVQKFNRLSEQMQQRFKPFTNALVWNASTFKSEQEYTFEVTLSQNLEIAVALAAFLGEYFCCRLDIPPLRVGRFGLRRV